MRNIQQRSAHGVLAARRLLKGGASIFHALALSLAMNLYMSKGSCANILVYCNNIFRFQRIDSPKR